MKIPLLWFEVMFLFSIIGAGVAWFWIVDKAFDAITPRLEKWWRKQTEKTKSPTE